MLTRIGLLAAIGFILCALMIGLSLILGAGLDHPQITLRLRTGINQRHIALLDVDRRLAARFDAPDFTDVVFPVGILRDGRTLATIATDEDGEFGLHLVDVTGRRVFTLPLFENQRGGVFRESPDARALAFMGHVSLPLPDGSPSTCCVDRVFRIDLATYDVEEVHPPETFFVNTLSAWSPDNAWIVYELGSVQPTSPDAGFSLFTIMEIGYHSPASGSRYTSLDAHLNQIVGFSPDSRYLVYQIGPAEPLRYQTLELETGQQRDVETAHRFVSGAPVQWLDGERLVMIVRMAGAGAREALWIGNVVTGEEQVIDLGEFSPARSSASPRGDRIAVVAASGSDTRLLMVDAASGQWADTAVMSRATRFTSRFIWSPDGAYVAYADDAEWVIAAASGSVRIPLGMVSNTLEAVPAWWLDDRRFIQARPSQDASGRLDVNRTSIIIVDAASGAVSEIVLAGGMEQVVFARDH